MIDARDPWNAVLYYLSEPVTKADRIRGQISVSGVFDSHPIWKPSVSKINRHTGLVFRVDRLMGWANDPNTTGESPDGVVRNAPPPSNPVWNTIQSALNSQFGVESTWRYEEEMRRIGDIGTQQEIDELVVLLDQSEQEIRDSEVPVPVTMTEINL